MFGTKRTVLLGVGMINPKQNQKAYYNMQQKI